MAVTDRIHRNRDDLSATDRRVAEIVLNDPSAVAFGTVAALAARAGTSGASVVRFAHRLGFDGFVDLQAAVQDDLAIQLRPAVERIRQPADGDLVGRAAAVEARNVAVTLERVDRRALAAASARLAARRARVAVLPGSASFGVGALFADQLGLLRDGVSLVWGAPASVTAMLATLRTTDVAVAIDVPRYDTAVVEGVTLLAGRNVPVLALTDSTLSPLARHASATFTIASEGVGPFDSQVGALAVANVLAAAVAQRLRASATRRLDRIEQAWRTAGVLADS